ncbi:thermonuclease family protein [Henriciella aquimarina]|uniref:thermonuclease family protein n=1 Tax=Henriciella aquimarina TaxID=545261 RepID=UPI00117AE727|nr:thermonuclease family protein [Henriciella aquimarina]
MKNHLVAILAVSVLITQAACSYDVEADTSSDAADTVAGVASVVDGDTIEIHGKKIRLSGYDTPERGARCGPVNVYQKAAFALSDFIGQRTVSCAVTGTDRWDRLVATCSVGGKDLGDFIVSEGWGRDWPQYSQGRYADEEKRARATKSGLWGLDCPADLWGNRTYN